MNGQQKHGPKTENGRLSIAQVNATTGARCFSPVLPAEREEDWLAVLNGVRERIQPADRLEEEMAYNLAMALWQAQRLHRYEKAATHRQIESATGCRVPIVYIGSYIGAAISMADLPQFRTLVPQLRTAQTLGSGHFSPVFVPDQINAMLSFVAESSGDA